MSAAKPAVKNFQAVLERMEGNLGWVIIRLPFDAAKLWGKRGQLRIQGDINGFAFSSAIFPTGQGRLSSRQQKNAKGREGRARPESKIPSPAGHHAAPNCATQRTAARTGPIEAPT
ncbi:MAG TPA: DUF1905 domain-containing protein [Candidatus Angelobacter sp.]